MLFRSKKRYVVHTAGDPVLKGTAAPVLEVTSEIRTLAEDMLETLRIFSGIGIAAPQVGVALRMVVFEVPTDPEPKTELSPGEQLLLPRMPLTVINPEIISRSAEVSEGEEGCLSVPEIWAPVVRPSKVMFHATTLDGEEIECECGGLLGRCIQHELDHLDGILFVDRITPEAARTIERGMQQLLRYGRKHHYHRVKTK